MIDWLVFGIEAAREKSDEEGKMRKGFCEEQCFQLSIKDLRRDGNSEKTRIPRPRGG